MFSVLLFFEKQASNCKHSATAEKNRAKPCGKAKVNKAQRQNALFLIPNLGDVTEVKLERTRPACLSPAKNLRNLHHCLVQLPQRTCSTLQAHVTTLSGPEWHCFCGFGPRRRVVCNPPRALRGTAATFHVANCSQGLGKCVDSENFLEPPKVLPVIMGGVPLQMGDISQHKFDVYCCISLCSSLRSQKVTASQMGGVLRYNWGAYYGRVLLKQVVAD